MKATYVAAALLLVALICPAQQDNQPAASPMKVSAQEAFDHLQSKVIPEYPEMGIINRIQNNEVLKIVIDEQGQVVEASPVAGHPAFAKPSLDAIKQWKYRPFMLNDAAMRVETTVVIEYRLGGLEDYAPIQAPDAVVSCVVKPGFQDANATRIRVQREIMDGRRTKYVEATYPQMARVAHIQGDVVLRAVIDKEGRVANVRAVSGHPILIQAAMDAVKQWAYQPYLLNGEPVEVESLLTVRFHLGPETNQH
jgi:TonB family protein